MDDHTAKAIIFDFDGTIADSFTVTLRTIHQLLHRTLVKDDISLLRGMSSRQVLRELKIPLWRAFFLAARTRRLISNHLDEITIVPGIAEALESLAKNHELHILSSNSTANAHAFLEKHGIAKHFISIYGGVAPWGKAHALRRLARNYDLVVRKTWYVGDGDLDVKAAHRAGMKAAAVTWGFSNIHVLQKCHPDALVFSSDELVNCFVKER